MKGGQRNIDSPTLAKGIHIQLTNKKIRPVIFEPFIKFISAKQNKSALYIIGSPEKVESLETIETLSLIEDKDLSPTNIHHLAVRLCLAIFRLVCTLYHCVLLIDLI